jgi:transposase InsO family protein
MEKELLSIVETSQQYRHILLGSHCNFFCDHKNLGFNNFKSERVRRWYATLEEFDYSFIYCPGKTNIIADMLSRYPMTAVTTSKYEEIMTIEENSFPATTKRIKESQDAIKNLEKKLLSNPTIYSTIDQDGVRLFRRNKKIIVDPILFSELLTWYHTNLNHPGQDRTYKTINSVFYTPEMEAKVHDYVNKCQVCKKTKHPTKKYGHLPESDIICDPWEIIQINLFGPWTFQDITNKTYQIQGLSIIDVATRWVELCPYSSKKSEDIALLVDQNWFCRYPRPKIAMFDNGSEFSTEFRELLRSYGVIAKLSTIKNPQTNAFVERVHQTIADSIQTMELEKRECDDITINAVLQNVAYGLRATYHTSIAATPGQIVFGRDMVINSVYLANWKRYSELRKTQIQKNNVSENKSRINYQYKIGDDVYIRKSAVEQKLASLQGPFKIVDVHSNGTVTIRRSSSIRERINIRRLQPASPRSN